MKRNNKILLLIIIFLIVILITLYYLNRENKEIKENYVTNDKWEELNTNMTNLFEKSYRDISDNFVLMTNKIII